MIEFEIKMKIKAEDAKKCSLSCESRVFDHNDDVCCVYFDSSLEGYRSDERCRKCKQAEKEANG